MNKIAFITGASSGIGLSCAHKLAQAGYHLILTARRTQKLVGLASDIEKTYNIHCLALTMDVRNRKEVENSIQNLPQQWKKIDVLINNAGLALGLNPIDEGNVDDWDTMIDTNVKGLLYVSQAIIPLMKQNQSGHIINIGSIAGKEVYPKGNVYCATKFAVDAITKSMRIDLLPYNIKVTQVAPGATNTEFSLVRYKGDQKKASEVYNGFTPLCGDDIAEIVLFCITRPTHVNINDILVMPTQQATAGIFNKNL